jgi:hypothetical protein
MHCSFGLTHGVRVVIATALNFDCAANGVFIDFNCYDVGWLAEERDGRLNALNLNINVTRISLLGCDER